MKEISVFLASLALFCSPAGAAGGPPAKEAVRTLARERGAAWADRIVQIYGVRGTDQPETWHIVAAGSNGVLQEFFIGRKGIVREGPVPAAMAGRVNGPVVSPKTFTLDSTMAFMKANESARAARVGYDSVTYRLRSNGTRAVWFLELNNAAGAKVAELTVAAGSGKVSPMLLFPPQTPPQPQVLPQRFGSGLRRSGEWLSRKFSPR